MATIDLSVNWLAHIVLAGPDDEDRLGGVLADLVPMTVARKLPAGVRRGIALHLSIDAFSDAHPTVCASNRRIVNGGVGLRPAAAAIAVDMLYDHLLARDWVIHGPPGVPLEAFVKGFYALAADHRALFPAKARLTFAAMTAQDWFGSYRFVDEIRRALERIRLRLSPRAAAVSPLASAVDVFTREPQAFAEDFARFWPDVTAHAARVRAEAKNAGQNSL